MTTTRITHIRRIFDDGVISSTNYESFEYAMNEGVFSAMGAQQSGGKFYDPDTLTQIFGDGTVYMDIEVTDQLTIETGTGPSYQKIIRTFLWGDPWNYLDLSWGNQDDEGAARALLRISGSCELDPNRKMDLKIVRLQCASDR